MPKIVADSKRAKFTLYIKGNRMEPKDFINSVGSLPESSQKLLLKLKREFDISTSLLNMSMSQPEHVLQHKEARKYR